MRSLRVKFSALVVTLLVVACVSLASIATWHEREALGAEAEKWGCTLATNLAGSAQAPLVEVAVGRLGDELTLDTLVGDASKHEGVHAVRLLGLAGEVVASSDAKEYGSKRPMLASGAGRPAAGDCPVRRDARLLVVTAPIFSQGDKGGKGDFLGEAQIELDLGELVDAVVDRGARLLAKAAAAVICLGVIAGIAFVTLLVGPLRRLRIGVERLASGDLTVRVPPTSRDEVGQVTRAFNEMGDSLLQKQRIQSAFGRYVDDYVLAQLLEGPEEGDRAGIEREVTVLFADIRGFTRLSEGMEAREVVALLNEIFQLIADHILERGGTIDKFMGDSVMAYFGAPIPHPDHAQRAVSAAVDIARAIADRNKYARDPARGSPAPPLVEIGIGVHTGSVVVGDIGSDRRTDFTAVGDAVNVAHRLEKLARPGEILVSEVVQRRVRADARLRFEGERQLSGREESVHVYSVETNQKTLPPRSGDWPAS